MTSAGTWLRQWCPSLGFVLLPFGTPAQASETVSVTRAAWWCSCGGMGVGECDRADEGVAVVVEAGCSAHVKVPIQRDTGIYARVKVEGAEREVGGELSVSASNEAGDFWERTALEWELSSGILQSAQVLSPRGYHAMQLRVDNDSAKTILVVDAAIDVTSESVDPVRGTVVSATHREGLRLLSSGRASRYFMPVPGSYPRQVPLSVDIFVHPAESLSAIEYVSDSLGNLGAIVTIVPTGNGGRVEVGWDAVVLTALYPLSEDARLGRAQRVADWLVPTPSVSWRDGEIGEIANAILSADPSTTEIMDSVIEWQDGYLSHRKTWLPSMGRGVGARDVYRRRKATCVGRANLTAALLRASNVPTRVVSGVPVGAPVESHFIVESYAGGEVGWKLFDPGRGVVAYDRGSFVVTRVVAPEDELASYDSANRFAVAGVPLWSVDEVVEGWGTIVFDGRHDGVGGCRSCQSAASILYRVRNDDEGFEKMFARAQAVWNSRVASRMRGRVPPCGEAGAVSRLVSASMASVFTYLYGPCTEFDDGGG